MPLLQVNVWSLLTASLAVFLLGALWYSPLLFGNLWMKLKKISPKEMKKPAGSQMTLNYIGNYITNFITAFVLAQFLGYLNATTITAAVTIAFWAWLGFLGTSSFGGILWEKQPVKLYLLHNAYSLISLMIMAAILVSWV